MTSSYKQAIKEGYTDEQIKQYVTEHPDKHDTFFDKVEEVTPTTQPSTITTQPSTITTQPSTPTTQPSTITTQPKTAVGKVMKKYETPDWEFGDVAVNGVTEKYHTAIKEGIPHDQIVQWVKDNPQYCRNYFGEEYCGKQTKAPITSTLVGAKDIVQSNRNIDTTVTVPQQPNQLVPLSPKMLATRDMSKDWKRMTMTSELLAGVTFLPNDDRIFKNQILGKAVEPYSYAVATSDVTFDKKGNGSVKNFDGMKVVKYSKDTLMLEQYRMRDILAKEFLLTVPDYVKATQAGFDADTIVSTLHKRYQYITPDLAKALHIPDNVYKAYTENIPSKHNSGSFDRETFRNTLDRKHILVAREWNSVDEGRYRHVQDAEILYHHYKTHKDSIDWGDVDARFPDYATALDKGLSPREAINLFTKFSGKPIKEGDAVLLGIPEKLWKYHNELIWNETDRTTEEKIRHSIGSAWDWLSDGISNLWAHPSSSVISSFLGSIGDTSLQHKDSDWRMLRMYPNTPTAYNSRDAYVDIPVLKKGIKWSKGDVYRTVHAIKASDVEMDYDWYDEDVSGESKPHRNLNIGWKQLVEETNIPRYAIDYMQNEHMLSTTAKREFDNSNGLDTSWLDPIDIFLTAYGSIYTMGKASSHMISSALSSDIKHASATELMQLKNDLHFMQAMGMTDHLTGVSASNPLGLIDNLFEEYKLLNRSTTDARASLLEMTKQIVGNPDKVHTAEELERLVKLVNDKLQIEKRNAYDAAYASADDTVQYHSRDFKESLMRWLNNQPVVDRDAIGAETVRTVGAVGNVQVKNATYNMIQKIIDTKGLQLTPAQSLVMKNYRNAVKRLEHLDTEIAVTADTITYNNNFRRMLTRPDLIRYAPTVATRTRNRIAQHLATFGTRTRAIAEDAIRLFNTPVSGLAEWEQQLRRIYASYSGLGRKQLETYAKAIRNRVRAAVNVQTTRRTMEGSVPNADTLTEAEMFNMLKRFNEEIYGKTHTEKADKAIKFVFQRVKRFSEEYFRLHTGTNGVPSRARALFDNANSIAAEQYNLFGYNSIRGNKFDVAELGKLANDKYRKIEDLEESIIEGEYKMREVIRVISDPTNYNEAREAVAGATVGKQLAQRWLWRRLNRIPTSIERATTRDMIDLTEATTAIQNILKTTADKNFIKNYLGMNTYRDLISIEHSADVLKRALAQMPQSYEHALANGALSYIATGVPNAPQTFTNSVMAVPRLLRVMYDYIGTKRNAITKYGGSAAQTLGAHLRLPIVGSLVHSGTNVQYRTRIALGKIQKRLGALKLKSFTTDKLKRDKALELIDRTDEALLLRNQADTTPTSVGTGANPVSSGLDSVANTVENVGETLANTRTVSTHINTAADALGNVLTTVGERLRNTSTDTRALKMASDALARRNMLEKEATDYLVKLHDKGKQLMDSDVFFPTDKLTAMSKQMELGENKLPHMSDTFIREYNRELRLSIRDSTYREFMEKIWANETQIDKITEKMRGYVKKHNNAPNIGVPSISRKIGATFNKVFVGGRVYAMYYLINKSREVVARDMRTNVMYNQVLSRPSAFITEYDESTEDKRKDLIKNYMPSKQEFDIAIYQKQYMRRKAKYAPHLYDDAINRLKELRKLAPDHQRLTSKQVNDHIRKRFNEYTAWHKAKREKMLKQLRDGKLQRYKEEE